MEYLNVTERLSLAVLEMVKAAGTELALPTQTIQFADDQAVQTPKTVTSSDS